jgi:ABC-2 type transport system permease protein
MWRDVSIVFARELRGGLRGFLMWVVPVGAMLAMVCALQPSLAGGVLAAKLDSLPPAMRQAFGFQMVDFHRPAAYLATNFLYVTLTAGLFGATSGAAVVAREETLRTAELLFALPVSRTAILLGKAAAVLVYVVLYPTLLALIAMGVLGQVSDRPLEPALLASLFVSAGLLGVCFAGLGMFIATLLSDKRLAGGAALGAVLGTYFLGIISAIAAPAEPLRWLSPQKLLEPMWVLGNGLGGARVAALVALGGVAAAAAIARYRVQDIHA